MAGNYQKRGYLLEDFRLFHLNDVQGARTDYHYHEFHKLLFILSGTGSYTIEGQRYLLKAGDVVLIGRHCVHRPEFEPGQSYERVILYLSPAFLQKASTDGCDLESCFLRDHDHVLRLDGSSILELRQSLDHLEQELAEKRFGHLILSHSLLLTILVFIERHLMRSDAKLPAPILPKDERMLELLQYLDQHLTEEINIDHLAERFFLSRYHLMHRFREETGTTIHVYLSERRLLLARNLIASGLPATEACFACGYGSYSSFTRAYRKLFGATPTGRSGATVTEGSYE